MKKPVIHILIVLALFAFIFSMQGIAFAGSENNDYKKARDSYYELKSSEKLKSKRHNWERSINSFESFRVKHPNSSKCDDALYNVGILYRELSHYSARKDDLDASINTFRKLQKIYPHSSLADDSGYIIGLIYLEDYRMPIKASEEFEKVIAVYPNGDMAILARSRLIEIQKRIPALAEKSSTASSSTGSSVKEVKVWSNENYTKVAIYLDKPIGYEPHFLPVGKGQKGDSRIYLDLKPATLSPDLNRQISIGDGLLTRIRVGQNDPKTVRVVLDVTSVQEHTIIPYSDPARIVIDVYGAESGNAARPRSAKNGSTNSEFKIKKVVIDPGHGGKDPGAIGPNGTMEKDVVLAISKILAKKMKKELGVDVVLTRTKDVYLTLDERNAIANAENADLFLSIHANASKNRKSRGIETYHLNTADGVASQRAAARENGVPWSAAVPDLDYILADLTINFNSPYSAKLAGLVQESMTRNLKKNYSGINDLGVHTALFYVLVGAKCPSALVEVSFLSNYQEEKRLRSTKYQEEISEAIVNGVKRYVKEQETIAMNL